MPLTKRFGSLATSESSRVKTTLLAGSACAFLVMNSRPAVVDAHKVPVSLAARAIRPMKPPARSEPYDCAPRSPGLFVPSGPASATQSPHPRLFPGVVNSAVRLEKRLVAAVVLGSPDMAEAR